MLPAPRPRMAFSITALVACPPMRKVSAAWRARASLLVTPRGARGAGCVPQVQNHGWPSPHIWAVMTDSLSAGLLGNKYANVAVVAANNWSKPAKLGGNPAKHLGKQMQKERL